MPRVKRGVGHVKKRRNLLQLTKGYRFGRNSKIKQARVAALKAGVYAYRDRRTKKRSMRNLWIIRLNAGLRELGMTYSSFISSAKNANIELDRKVLSNIAKDHPSILTKIVEAVK